MTNNLKGGERLKNRQAIINIMEGNNFTLNYISEVTGISNTSLRDFIKDITDKNFQQLGSKSVPKLKELFNKYGYEVSFENVPKLYGQGICDITGLDENGKQSKCYESWKGMFRRCYSDKWQEREPTYKGCSVCDEWKFFSNYKKWFDENYYVCDGMTDKDMQLDKDILNKGNKVYSPNSCVFVPQIINTLFTKSNAIRNDLCIGVQYNSISKKFKYRSQASYYDFNEKRKKKINLGNFNDKIEAFNTYKQFKEKNIKRMADHYKYDIPIKLYESMYNYIVEITD